MSLSWSYIKSVFEPLVSIDIQLSELLSEIKRRFILAEARVTVNEADIVVLEAFDLANQRDYASISFDGNATAQVIDLVDVYHLVVDWDVDGPEVISNADSANARIAFGDSRAYFVAFTVESNVIGAAQTGVFDAFSIVSTAGKTITNITQANPGVVTSAGHGLSDGDHIKIINVVGMTQVNNHIYVIANKADDTFELTDEEGVDINTGGYTAYSSGGVAYEAILINAHTDQRYDNASVTGAAGHNIYVATAQHYCELYFKNETSANDITHEGGTLTIHGI